MSITKKRAYRFGSFLAQICPTFLLAGQRATPVDKVLKVLAKRNGKIHGVCDQAIITHKADPCEPTIHADIQEKRLYADYRCGAVGWWCAGDCDVIEGITQVGTAVGL